MSENISDKEFMADPRLWVRWPFLPVKRYKEGDSWPEIGFMVVTKSRLSTVFTMNLFRFLEEKFKLEDVPKIEYSNLDDLVADGWVVD